MGILGKARPENYFRCADGSALGSVYELEDRLCTMSNETFRHHANQARNDFHNWIKDVFQDYELAGELLTAKTRAEAAAIVRKHLRRELLAKEEIENAIKNASTTKTKQAKAAVKARHAKAAPKQLEKPRLKPRAQRKKTRQATKKKAKRRAAAIKVANLNPNRARSQVGSSRNSARGGMRSPAKARLAIGPSRRSDLGNRKLNKNKRDNRKVKRGKRAHKRTKKKVNRWLNWLKIVPEL